MHWKVIVFFLFLVHMVQTFNGDRFYINLRPHLSQTHSQQPLSFSSLWELMLWNSRGLFSGALCISAHALGEKKDKPRKSRIDFSHLVFPKHFSQSSFCRFYLSASWRPATLCYASGGGQLGVLRCGPFAGFILFNTLWSFLSLLFFFFTQKLKPYQSCDESVYRARAKKRRRENGWGLGIDLRLQRKKKRLHLRIPHTQTSQTHTHTHRAYISKLTVRVLARRGCAWSLSVICARLIAVSWDFSFSFSSFCGKKGLIFIKHQLQKQSMRQLE